MRQNVGFGNVFYRRISRSLWFFSQEIPAPGQEPCSNTGSGASASGKHRKTHGFDGFPCQNYCKMKTHAPERGFRQRFLSPNQSCFEAFYQEIPGSGQEPCRNAGFGASASGKHRKTRGSDGFSCQNRCKMKARAPERGFRQRFSTAE